MSHLVCPAKYRRVVLSEPVDETLRKICVFLESCYEITFLEIGSNGDGDGDHVHFLLQSVPTMSPSRIAQLIKSLTARELFRRLPSLREQFWGGVFWSSGYVINTVSRSGSESRIRAYVQQPGQTKDYGYELFSVFIRTMIQATLPYSKFAGYLGACSGGGFIFGMIKQSNTF